MTRHTPPPSPNAAGRPGVSRRTLLAEAGLAGAAGIAATSRASAAPEVRPKQPDTWVSVTDFGAVGDGTTDDRAALQAALDWAGQHPGAALHLPARIFGIGGPLRVPEDIELTGQVPGSGNRPLCGFRALPGFQSELVQRYQAGDAMQSLDIAALLVCKEWTENAEFAGRLHIRDLFFDVDGQTDTRGAPIHGMVLSNQQLDLHNVWIRHPTGYGVWINTQRPDGGFVQPIVDNVLRRVWVRGAGIGGATFVTDHGPYRYGGFLIGALPGTRDGDGNSEPALATDGILDYCTVSVGPEKGVGCHGNGIHITQAAGWRLCGCHINGAGRHGLRLRKAYLTEVSGNYVDGWGVAAAKKEGNLGAIWCTSLVSLEPGVEGGLLVYGNRVRARPVRVPDGNRFTALGLRAGSTGMPRAIVTGNILVRRHDATHSIAAFDFGRSGGGKLETMVVGNSVTGVDRLFLRDWDEAAVSPRFTGNNFQHAPAPPAAGWHPAGLRIDNTTPGPGSWSGWIATAAGEPGTWKGVGRIES